jgi:two-component system chemotaxis sensor kinase CheA
MEDDYVEEVQAAIGTLQTGLIALSGGGAEPEVVNELFRASHSIKGQSGQMSARPLERVAHKLEDVLDLVRHGKLTLTPTSVEALLGVIDALQDILEQLRSTRHVEFAIERELGLMERIARGEASPQRSSPQLPAQPPPAQPQLSSQKPPTRPLPEGQGLAPKGPKKPAAGPKAGAAPPPGGEVAPKAKAQYLRVDFGKVDQVMNLVGDLFINKIKLHDGVLVMDELHLQVKRLLGVLAQRHDAGRAGIALDDEESRRLLQDMTALAADLERLTDRLGAATNETDMISNDLRDQIMVMRMVPLDSLFGRLGRVVFDAVQKESRGHETGWKQAKLVVEGADAEIDKVIANTLEVPLVHIVRNSVAHGIESAADRKAAGKPAEGTVRLQAGQRGSQFVIQVTDDGRGMDPEVIGATAVKRGLIDADELETMSDKEILVLIFRAGFTTAEKADDLKGRGVGLDEVMSKINQVKGGIEVESVVGEGSKVTLSLPLTLAINTVLIGEVAGETLALPMSAVERVVRLAESQVEHMGEAEVFTLQSQTVPLVRVDDLLAMGRARVQRPDACYVVVLSVGEKRFGLTFDKMTGKQDVVIKSLGTLLVEAPLVAGSTLLGERCILILDPVDIAVNLGRSRVEGSRRAKSRSDRALRPRLLLVDDDALIRLKLRRVFEDAGLDVHEAADGAEGLEAAKATVFQMVSTDVVMPRLDGYELTRRLRQMEAYRNVPILMISAKAEDVDKRAGFEAGVDYYLVKPVERSELLELIEEVRL